MVNKTKYLFGVDKIITQLLISILVIEFKRAFANMMYSNEFHVLLKYGERVR